MLHGGNLHYEMGERTGAVGCGGVGVIHTLANGWPGEGDRRPLHCSKCTCPTTRVITS